MSIIDLVLVATLAYNCFKGLYRGFIGIVIDIVSLGLSFYVGITFYQSLGAKLQVLLSSDSVYLYLLSFMLLWSITYGATHIFGKSIRSIFTFSILKPVDIAGGGLVGVLRGALILSPFVIGIVFFELPIMEDSIFIPHIQPFIETFLSKVLK